MLPGELRRQPCELTSGIQHFTILSDAMTTAADVASNFFLEPTSIGQPIAKEEVRLVTRQNTPNPSFLCELNPAVTGEARVADAAELLESDPAFYLSHNLIITSNIPPQLEERIADLLWQSESYLGRTDASLLDAPKAGHPIDVDPHVGSDWPPPDPGPRALR